MALGPSNSSSLEQLALKGLTCVVRCTKLHIVSTTVRMKIYFFVDSTNQLLPFLSRVFIGLDITFKHFIEYSVMVVVLKVNTHRHNNFCTKLCLRKLHRMATGKNNLLSI